MTSSSSATNVTMAMLAKACCSRVRSVAERSPAKRLPSTNGTIPMPSAIGRQMLEQRARHSARGEISLGGHRVGPERARQLSGRKQHHATTSGRARRRRPRAPAVLPDKQPQRRTDRAASASGTIDEQDRELRSGQDRYRDRNQQHDVVPNARRDGGGVQRQHRPEKHRVGERPPSSGTTTSAIHGMQTRQGRDAVGEPTAGITARRPSRNAGMHAELITNGVQDMRVVESRRARARPAKSGASSNG